MIDTAKNPLKVHESSEVPSNDCEENTLPIPKIRNSGLSTISNPVPVIRKIEVKEECAPVTNQDSPHSYRTTQLVSS